MKKNKSLPTAARSGTDAGRDSAERVSTRTIAAILGAAYMCAVLWVTLRPIPWAAAGSEGTRGILDAGAWIDGPGWTEGRPVEVILNVLMFVPVGITGGLLVRGMAALMGPLVLTVAIELVQIPLDRISHPRDLAANAAGAIIGLIVVMVLRRRRRFRRSALQSHRGPAPLSEGWPEGWSDRPWITDDGHGRQKASAEEAQHDRS